MRCASSTCTQPPDVGGTQDPPQPNEHNMSNDGTVALNNYLQARSEESRLSWAESVEGPPHNSTWTAICKIEGQEFARGVGSQKYLAKDAAAKEALKKLKGDAT